MKKTGRRWIALLMALAMVLSLGMTAGAVPSGSGTRITQVEFVADGQSVHAKTFVYGGAEGSKAVLVCAAYKTEGGSVILQDVKTAEGVGVLETQPVTVGENVSLRAYVWDQETMAPISDVAAYQSDFEALKKKLEITFDGQSFADYMDEPFDAAKTNYEKAVETYPQVKASIPGDSTVEIHIENNDDKCAVTLRRNRQADPGSNISSGSFTIEAYKWTESVTYTIDWTVRQKFNDDVLSFRGATDSGRGSQIVQVESFGATWYGYSKEYTVTEEKQSVKLSISNWKGGAAGLIIFKPKEDTDKGSMVVNDPQNWQQDGWVIDDVDGENKPVWGKQTAAAVQLRYGTNADEPESSVMLRVHNNLHGAKEDGTATGSRVAENRHPSNAGGVGSEMQVNIAVVPDKFEGCEYIVRDKWENSYENAQLDVDIYHSGTIYFVAPYNDITVTDRDTKANYDCKAISEPNKTFITGDYTAFGLLRIQKDSVSERYSDKIPGGRNNIIEYELMLAYLVGRGYTYGEQTGMTNEDGTIAPDIYIHKNAQGYIDFLTFRNFGPMAEAAREGHNLMSIALRDWEQVPGSGGAIKTEEENPTSIVEGKELLCHYCGDGSATNFKARTEYTKFEDYPAYTHETSTVDSVELIQNLKVLDTEALAAEAETKFPLTHQRFITDVGKLYKGQSNPAGSVYHVFTDRNNGIGNVLHYPSIYGLEGSEHFTWAISYHTATGSTTTEHFAKTTEPWFSFDVGADCEVWVFGEGSYLTELAEELPTWHSYELPETDNWAFQLSAVQKLNTVSIGSYSKGDTVTIYYPGRGGYLQIFVKPVQK